MQRRRGLRQRMDGLEAHAHGVMFDASMVLASIREACTGLLEDIQDGVTFELVRTGGSFADFLSGVTNILPFALRMVPKEKEAGETEGGA